MKAQIEKQILRILTTKTNRITLSNKLCGPGGLFNQLVEGTGEERKVITQSSLFQKAQKRLSELEYSEAKEFFKAVDKMRMAKSKEQMTKSDGSSHSRQTTKSSRKSQALFTSSSKKRR